MGRPKKQPAQIVKLAVPSGTEDEQNDAIAAAEAALSNGSLSTVEEPEDSQVTPAETEIDDLLSELPDANKVNVYRISQNGMAEYVGTGDPRVVCEQEYIRANYGAGKYRLLIYVKGKYAKVHTLVVGAGIPGAPAIIPHINTNLGGSGEVGLLRQQLEQQHTLMLSIINAKQSGGEKIGDIVAAVSAMQKLTQAPPPADPMGGMNAMLGVISKLMEIAKPEPAVDEKTSWVRFAQEALSALPLVLDRAKGMIQATQAPPTAQAADERGNIAVVTETERASHLLKQGIGFLKGKILKGQDPSDWVTYVLNQLDDSTWRTIALEVINRPWEQLELLDPEMKIEPFVGWFKSFVSELKEAMMNREPEDETGIHDSLENEKKPSVS